MFTPCRNGLRGQATGIRIGGNSHKSQTFYPSSALRAPSPTRGEGELSFIRPAGTFSHKERRRAEFHPPCRHDISSTEQALLLQGEKKKRSKIASGFYLTPKPILSHLTLCSMASQLIHTLNAFPMKKFSGTNPQTRLSSLLSRLSPIIKYWPGGT